MKESKNQVLISDLQGQNNSSTNEELQPEALFSFERAADTEKHACHENTS